MSKKIKVNIPGFGKTFCSNYIGYEIYKSNIFNSINYYIFYKKGTEIRHNEYVPAIKWKNGYYNYLINNKHHRLSGYTCCYGGL